MTMRLDVYLTEHGFASSRTEAKNLITSSAVKVCGRVITKPAFNISEDCPVSVEPDTSVKKYVSRGGLKLEAALDAFGISASGRLALDVGASSGGFTDCLLKRGAARVIAVDSGSGQLVHSLGDDERVISKENFNARYLSANDLEYSPDIAVMDVSFISATHIIPAVYSVLLPGGDFVCLVKPQFEVGRANVGKGGIVKSEKARKEALSSVVSFAENIGFMHIASIRSPIEGGDGNIEYLIHLRKPFR